jgi:hypothetical protein
MWSRLWTRLPQEDSTAAFQDIRLKGHAGLPHYRDYQPEGYRRGFLSKEILRC